MVVRRIPGDGIMKKSTLKSKQPPQAKKPVTRKPGKPVIRLVAGNVCRTCDFGK
jgi:hypothetical protein